MKDDVAIQAETKITDDVQFRAELGARAGRFITEYLGQRALDGEALPFLPKRLMEMKDPYMGCSIFAITAFHRLLYKVAIVAADEGHSGEMHSLKGAGFDAQLQVSQRQIDAYLPEIVEAMLLEAGVPPRHRPPTGSAKERVQ